MAELAPEASVWYQGFLVGWNEVQKGSPRLSSCIQSNLTKLIIFQGFLGWVWSSTLLNSGVTLRRQAVETVCLAFHSVLHDLLAMRPLWLQFPLNTFHGIIVKIKRSQSCKVLGTVPKTRWALIRGYLLLSSLLLLYFFGESILARATKKPWGWSRCSRQASSRL